MVLSTYAILGLEYLLNGLWAYWVSRNKHLDLCQYLQVSIDIILIMAAIYLAGGIENTWGFVPAMIIVMAGVHLSYSTAVYLALLSFLLFAAMAIGEIYGFIPHFSAYGFSESIWKKADYVQDYVIGMAVLYSASAFISGYFGERIRESNTWLEKEVAKLRARLEKKLEETHTELYQRNKELESVLAERKRAEEKLIESEKKYRDLVETAPIGIYRTTLKGEVLLANKALCEILDYPSVEEFKKGGSVAKYKDPKAREGFIARLKEQGRVNGFETELLTRTGQAKNVIINSILENDVTAGMIMDITERRRAEDDLKQKMAEVEKANRFMLDRESRVVELKDEVNDLLKQLHQPAKYKI
jgi:PAS domain S-box-containing protein